MHVPRTARAAPGNARASRGADGSESPGTLKSLQLYAKSVLKFSTEIVADPATTAVLSVRLSTSGRHPKTSGFDVAEGRI
jgi:hypothetical protein